MALFALLTAMRRDPGFARLAGHPAQNLSIVAPPTLNPLIVAELAQSDRLVVALTATNRESEDLVAALSGFLGADAVAEFPSWETLPHERLSPGADIVGVRIAALRRIKHPEADRPLRVIVCPVRALLQPLVMGLGDLEPVRLLAKQEIAFDDAVQQLAAA
ncbi:MAG: transcription-repair coupling factor, partial [Candidatus Nanopelagicales bacterium]